MTNALTVQKMKEIATLAEAYNVFSDLLKSLEDDFAVLDSRLTDPVIEVFDSGVSLGFLEFLDDDTFGFKTEREF